MSTGRLHVTTADENPRFRAFWHRQKESLDRKRARLQNRAPSVPMPQVSLPAHLYNDQTATCKSFDLHKEISYRGS